MSQVDPNNNVRAESGPVIPQIFPTLDPLRVRIPIVASEMTIWPGPKETFWEWVEGVSSLRCSVSQFVWRRKLARIIRRSERGS